MVKIEFTDRSYIEITKSNTPNKVFVAVAAKSVDNAQKLVVNCIELTQEELLKLFKSI